MRYWEILTEASTPTEEVICYFEPEEGREAVLIGGRLIVWDTIRTAQYTLRNLNLKNVRAHKGPLLFHGSVCEFEHFADMSWFGAEPSLAVGHALFWKSLGHGKDGWMYVCSVDIKSPIYNPPIVPGEEKPGDLKALFDANPDCDAIVWKDTRDAGSARTDLYNIKHGKQVKILKKWRIHQEEVTPEEFAAILAGQGLNREEPTKEKRPGAIFRVTEPGLSPFEKDDYITPEEYREFKDYLVAVRDEE